MTTAQAMAIAAAVNFGREKVKVTGTQAERLRFGRLVECAKRTLGLATAQRTGRAPRAATNIRRRGSRRSASTRAGPSADDGPSADSDDGPLAPAGDGGRFCRARGPPGGLRTPGARGRPAACGSSLTTTRPVRRDRARRNRLMENADVSIAGNPFPEGGLTSITWLHIQDAWRRLEDGAAMDDLRRSWDRLTLIRRELRRGGCRARLPDGAAAERRQRAIGAGVHDERGAGAQRGQRPR